MRPKVVRPSRKYFRLQNEPWSNLHMTQDFKSFTHAFCDILGAKPPALTVDDQGRQAFHTTMYGTTVSVLHRKAVAHDLAFVVFNLGAMPKAQGERGGFDLLDLNFQLIGKDSPVFARNPATGDILLQASFRFAEKSPHDLLHVISQCADLAAMWRAGLDPGNPRAAQHALDHFA